MKEEEDGDGGDEDGDGGGDGMRMRGGERGVKVEMGMRMGWG